MPKKPPIRAPEKIRLRARELRQRMTPAETALWARLRKRQLAGLKFRRQHPIERFIVDFYCPSARLIVEVDGKIHDYQKRQDAARDAFLTQRGYRILRFRNESVLQNIEKVLDEIKDEALSPGPSPARGRGAGGEGANRQTERRIMTHQNPFIFGDPVRGDDFLDRRRELRRLMGRIRQGGSALITAEPRMGKTSLLLRLQEAAEELRGENTGQIFFSYLDGHNMSGWDAGRFWRAALRPLDGLSQVRAAVRNRNLADFSLLEGVFRELGTAGVRFVLLLDEFDVFQDEPGLHQRAVYGALRSLASRHRSFSLVVASRRSTTDLNVQARDFSSGSPYFNFMQEITLAPFPKKDVEILLARAEGRFTPADRAFLMRLAGQHPYFLQTAAYYLWDWYEEEENPAARYKNAALDFYRTAGETVLSDIWASWTPYMQMAFTLSVLDTMPLLLGETNVFDVNALLHDLPNFSPELRKLAARGFLRPDEDLQNGYTPHAEVMLWYMADELTRVIRPTTGLETWLTAQRWEGFLKRGEKDAIKRTLGQIAPLLKDGAKAFIIAAAEGAAKGLTGG